MENRAKFKYSYYDKYNKCRMLVYEYRGYEYEVQDRGMTMFSAYTDHKWEQSRIDKRIELENNPLAPQTVSCSDALDMLFDYWNGNESAFD